jgi:RNA polymerase sigma-70 factor, ECF subfamily
MASSFPDAMNHAGVLSTTRKSATVRYNRIYNQHCHKIYSLAFWMTDNELLADELSANTFLRAFSGPAAPGPEQIDEAFLTEVRESTPIGNLTLNVSAGAESAIRGNVKRAHLERAVVQLPATERLIFLLHDVEGYEHEKIGPLLGLDKQECQLGLHQARVFLRQALAAM